MSGVQEFAVTAEEEGLRLDRWFRRRFPALGHARLERLLRTGQVRVDGRRVKASYRIETGQRVRVPPLPEADTAAKALKQRPPAIDAEDARALQESVLYRDDAVLVIDKPAGLAVQGGSATTRHLDGMLDALRFDAVERPRLVHRLDKDTSGVLVLARTAKAAATLTRAFREGGVHKVYWAIVVGVPRHRHGRVSVPLAKRPGQKGERVTADPRTGRHAVSEYHLVDRAGRRAAWLALRPLTGRTHQLRAHTAAMGTPILGDGKYGRRQAFLEGLDLANRLHLHAHEIALTLPDGRPLRVTAPLPAHLAESMHALGFSEADYRDPFDEIGRKASPFDSGYAIC